MFHLKWIPAAVLALAGTAALAQSSVTIYGRIDAGLVVGKFDGATTHTQLASGPYTASRLGFRGTEDLGGGLRAGFQLEGSLNIDNGSGGGGGGGYAFNRGSQVSLGSDSWGEFALGKMYMPTFWVYLASDPGIGGLGLGSMGASIVQQHTALTGKTGWGGFYDNTVRYRTPNLSGFKAELAYSLNGGSINTDVASNEQSGAAKNDGRAAGFNAQYEQGPLYLGGAYQRFTTFKVATGTADQTTWMLAGRYKIALATVGVNYGQTKNSTACYAGTTTTTGNTLGCDMRTFAINSRWDITGQSAVDVSFGQLAATSGAKDGAKANTVALGYTYYLSKRTWLYTQATKMNNNSKANWNFNGAGFVPAGNVTPLGAGPQALALGIFHMF